MSYTLFFIVITDINVMVTESTRVAQVEDPKGTEDNAVQTSAGEPNAVEFVAAPVAVEATTITIPEVLATTSTSKEPVVALIPAQVELAPVSVDTTHTIMEKKSRSASTGLSPATDIMEELAHQMVQQFFTSMKVGPFRGKFFRVCSDAS